MTSWALVADVYFLPPQKMQDGESAEQFAARVQHMIADVAKLRIVSWDGYLKYYSLAEKVCWRCFCDIAWSFAARNLARARSAHEAPLLLAWLHMHGLNYAHTCELQATKTHGRYSRT